MKLQVSQHGVSAETDVKGIASHLTTLAYELTVGNKGLSLSPIALAYQLQVSIGLFILVMTLADTAEVSDDEILGIGKGLSDIAQATEQEIRAIGKNLTDTPAISEAYAAALGRALSDVAALADDSFLGIGKGLSDSSLISESLRRDFHKFISEHLYSTDDLDGEASAEDDQEIQFVKTRTELTFASEVLAFVSSKALADTSIASELISNGLGKVLADSSAATEAIAFAASKVLADSAFADEDETLAFGKALTDSVIPTDDPSLGFGKAATDTAVATEDETFAIGKGLSDTGYPDDGARTNKQDYTLDDTYFAQIYVEQSVETAARRFIFFKVSTDAAYNSDLASVGLGKVRSDSAAASDSGSLIGQGYTVDLTYFAEDYVGYSRTFT